MFIFRLRCVHECLCLDCLGFKPTLTHSGSSTRLELEVSPLHVLGWIQSAGSPAVQIQPRSLTSLIYRILSSLPLKHSGPRGTKVLFCLLHVHRSVWTLYRISFQFIVCVELYQQSQEVKIKFWEFTYLRAVLKNDYCFSQQLSVLSHTD